MFLLKSFSFTPKNTPVTIGRLNCSIDLNDDFLSRKHCMIEFKDNNWVLRDGNKKNASKNGYYFEKWK